MLRQISSKGIYALLLLTILLRVEHRYFYRNFYVDTEIQIAAAANLLKANGLSLAQADPLSLSISYQPLFGFTPGYSLLMIPPYLLLKNWIWASFLLDCVAIILLFAAIHLWFRFTFEKKRNTYYSLFLVFAAFSPAPFHYLTASGLWACATFAWGLYALYRILDEPSDKKWMFQAILILAMFFSVLLRYAYVSVAILPPIMMAFVAWQKKDKGLCSMAIINMLMLSLLLGGLAIYQYSIQGSVNYLQASSRGFFPAHLLSIDPFPFKAFVYYGIPHELYVKELSAYLYVGLKSISYICSAFILFLLLFHWIKPGALRNTAISSPKMGTWLLISLCVIFANVAILAYLSLKVPAESWNWTSFWTYVMESRYYMPSMLVILLSVYGLAEASAIYLFRQLIRAMLLVALLASMSYPLYLKYQIHIQHEWENTFVYSDIPQILEQIDSLTQADEQPVIFSSNPLRRCAEWLGVASLPWEAFIELDTLTIPQNCHLIVYVAAEESLDKNSSFLLESFDRYQLNHGVLFHRHFRAASSRQ